MLSSGNFAINENFIFLTIVFKQIKEFRISMLKSQENFYLRFHDFSNAQMKRISLSDNIITKTLLDKRKKKLLMLPRTSTGI